MSDSSRHITVTHPTSNTVSRALIQALDQAELLEYFFTCIATGDDDTNPLRRKLFAQRRCHIPTARLRLQPWREVMRLLSQKIPGSAFLRKHEEGPFCVDRVYEALDQKVAHYLESTPKAPSAIYAYEDGALNCFTAAKKRSIQSIYDLPIGYWRAARRIQREEAELKPEWAATMPALKDSEQKTARKDQELQLADTIIVASRFTADTLLEAPFDLPAPIVIPYGCPQAREVKDVLRPRHKNDKLKILFVGSLGQRKGLAYLLEAVEQMGDRVELTLVGRKSATCPPLEKALNQHHWIESLAHPQILQIMSEQDVLVFPSLFEGFGLVLTEALSQGLPIITTTHTAAPDLITDGKEGFIVPIRDSEAIASRLEQLYKDPDLLQSMRQAAVTKAQSQTWQHHQDEMARALEAALNLSS